MRYILFGHCFSLEVPAKCLSNILPERQVALVIGDLIETWLGEELAAEQLRDLLRGIHAW